MSLFINIACNFCYEHFNIDLQIGADFYGQNDEIYDCTICCNPNRITYFINDGMPENIIVSDGNE
jgi:hypothetical protein